MDNQDVLMRQLVETFRQELEDNAQSLVKLILGLEEAMRKKNDDPDRYEATIKDLLRLAHNIKGASRAVGFSDVAAVAHKLEDLITFIKVDNSRISHEMVNIMLHAIDAIKEICNALAQGNESPVNLNQLLETLQNPIDGVSPEKVERQKIPAETVSVESESIRVSINKLEHLSVIADSFQLQLLHLNSCVESTKKLLEKHLENTVHKNELMASRKLYSDFSNVINGFERILQDMRYETKQLRLVPASLLLGEASRIVRDVAQELKKEVQLEIKGDHIEVDRKVLTVLHEPLIHLLRNAIDHGIGTPEQRRKANKPEAGRITIEVSHQGEKINLKVSDDGQGIDKQAILATAIRKKMIKEEDAKKFTEKEILDLIFRPDFSIKPMITAVSGRGIGMDVVRNNVTHINGTVEVESQFGKGTSVSILVPLTIATDRGLIVRSGKQLFAIPSLSIERLVTVAQQDLVEVEGNIAIIIDNNAVPLRDLNDVLFHDNAAVKSSGKILVVILSVQGRKLGLIVDEILSESAIVIKLLSAPLHNISCISGGTIYNEGEIALVLNPLELLTTASAAVQPPKEYLKNTQEEILRQKILVVDDSITTRTLEKNILENHGYEIITAVDGQEAFSILNKHRFDLIVTDVLMPNMDGFELTERIKKSEKYKHIPVVIVTTLDSDNEKQKGLEVGADAYIIKQEFESQTLIQIVQQLL